MQRTYYSNRRMGLLADSDFVRSRPNSRSLRPIYPSEPVIRIDLGDLAGAVDSGWRSWSWTDDRVA
ncbi:MAG: hypothetical protein KQH83_10370 [Actinobacteria bacterium]|nr:hypothetical protein [Actinomycetota bacterium]